MVQANERLTLTAEEAAQQLGISMPSMYQLCRKADFPSLRVGRKILVSLSGLEKWIDKQAAEGGR